MAVFPKVSNFVWWISLHGENKNTTKNAPKTPKSLKIFTYLPTPLPFLFFAAQAWAFLSRFLRTGAGVSAAVGFPLCFCFVLPPRLVTDRGLDPIPPGDGPWAWPLVRFPVSRRGEYWGLGAAPWVLASMDI
jgi:hypothetical protein